jgi:cytochrome d ubiquinol oxidase subunit I
VWIFGWNRLSKKAHLASIWMVALGTAISAAFIMAANSWMQHPVGYVINKETGQPQLNNIWALFTNPVFIWSYVHVLLASLVTAGVIMLGISAWHLRRGENVDAFKRAAVVSMAVLLPATVLALFVGSELGVIEATYQPMKIAAAEAQWNTCESHCSFSLLQVGGGNEDQTPTQIISIPGLLSILATNSINGEVKGLNQLNAEYQKEYGPGDYVPNVFIQYWSMRVMAYLATLVFIFSLWGAVLLFRHRLEHAKWFLRLAPWVVILPFLINTAGWMLTENGRQPWIVQGLMKTAQGVSPSVSATDIWISIIVFAAVFAVVGVIDAVLMIRYGRRPLGGDPLAKVTSPDEHTDGPGEPPAPSDSSVVDESVLIY